MLNPIRVRASVDTTQRISKGDLYRVVSVHGDAWQLVMSVLADTDLSLESQGAVAQTIVDMLQGG